MQTDFVEISENERKAYDLLVLALKDIERAGIAACAQDPRLHTGLLNMARCFCERAAELLAEDVAAEARARFPIAIAGGAK